MDRLTSGAAVMRLWRVRKDSRTMHAELRDEGDGSVSLAIFYNAEMLHTRRWPSRGAAVAEAADRLRELQREGWSTHW